MSNITKHTYKKSTSSWTVNLKTISEASVCKFGELAIEINPQIVEAHSSGKPHHKNLPLNALSGINPYFL
jgi:hypothetical protein